MRLRGFGASELESSCLGFRVLGIRVEVLGFRGYP